MERDCHAHRGHVSDARDVERAASGVATIIHLAAPVGVGGQYDWQWAIIAEGTRRIAEAAAANGARSGQGSQRVGRPLRRWRRRRPDFRRANHLMDPALLKEFCEEFTRESNRLRMEAPADIDAAKAEIAKPDRELNQSLKFTLKDGPIDLLNTKMIELETTLYGQAGR